MKVLRSPWRQWHSGGQGRIKVSVAVDQSRHQNGLTAVEYLVSFFGGNIGTYCGDETVGQIGAGTGTPLSIREQLALAFYPTRRLTEL